MHSYLSMEISELLSEIENVEFGISVNTEDICAAREIGKVRTIALLILLPEQEKKVIKYVLHLVKSDGVNSEPCIVLSTN